MTDNIERPTHAYGHTNTASPSPQASMSSSQLDPSPQDKAIAKPTAGPLVALKLHQVKEAASLSAGAFLNSSSYSYIYEALDPAQKLEALIWLFEVNIRSRVEANGGAWCAFEEDDDDSSKVMVTSKPPPRMLCFFMLQPPGTEDIGTWQMIKNGILLFPYRFGYQAFRRLLEVKSYHETIEAQTFKTHGTDGGEGFAQLERMVVHVSAQGCGIGSRCLKEGLTKASKAGHSVLLETQLQVNVAFYERLGFEVLARDDEYFKVDGSGKVTNWTMMKRAA